MIEQWAMVPKIKQLGLDAGVSLEEFLLCEGDDTLEQAVKL